jgi:hypothetical protein
VRIWSLLTPRARAAAAAAATCCMAAGIDITDRLQ